MRVTPRASATTRITSIFQPRPHPPSPHTSTRAHTGAMFLTPLPSISECSIIEQSAILYYPRNMGNKHNDWTLVVDFPLLIFCMQVHQPETLNLCSLWSLYDQNVVYDSNFVLQNVCQWNNAVLSTLWSIRSIHRKRDSTSSYHCTAWWGNTGGKDGTFGFLFHCVQFITYHLEEVVICFLICYVFLYGMRYLYFLGKEKC